jgi:DNA-binding MarR family transcriptional regulator
MHSKRDPELAEIERAMVALRRRQTRRARAQGAGTPAPRAALFEVINAIDAAEEAGTPASVSAIADTLDLAQPRASKLVAEAVAAGLVRREPDQADGRRTLLVRTAAGRALCDEVHGFRRGAFAEAMGDWNARDRAAFARLLSRFVAGLDDRA